MQNASQNSKGEQMSAYEFHIVKVADVKIGERVRQDIGEDFEELKESIKTRGQMNPILVDRTDGVLTLLGGFRRLTAMKEIGRETILARFYDELDEIEQLNFEREENIHKTLTWDELAVWRKRFHEANLRKYGAQEKTSGNRPVEGTGWSQVDTARALGVSEGLISQDLRLAEAIETFPELKNITSRKQAVKAIARTEEVAILSELAKRDALRSRATDTETEQNYHLYCGNSVEIIKEKVSDETVDLVIFDPPWGVDITKIASSRGPTGEKTSYKDDSWGGAIELVNQLLPQIHRVMKADAHMYMFCGIQDFFFWINLLNGFTLVPNLMNDLRVSIPPYRESPAIKAIEDTFKDFYKTRDWNFHVEPIPLIWVKESGGFTDFDYKFMPRYEIILFCSKGQKKPLNEVTSNIFEYKRPVNTERIHTQEKPIELIQKLIRLSSQENEIVLDPTAGSFVTAVASTLLQRRSICIDNDEVCYAKGLERMSNIVMSMHEEEEDE
jgi:site-specific DNA-methyltransferase (adenine-specific)